jgi:hypothetical protein
VVWAAELHHRGERIRNALADRRAVRRSRRNRKTRYRKLRFLNRRRPAGWLPPSLESRVANIQTWVARLRRACPITSLALEVVRFDTQALQNPEISGVAYQQGTLHGYEIREYVVRRVTRIPIALAESYNGKGCCRVSRLTWRRKPKGTRACRKSG